MGGELKTAIVHEWFTVPAGAELVVKYIHKLYPAPIYAILKDDKKLKGTYFEDKTIITSFIQRLPFAKKHYRKYLLLFPLAVEQFNLEEYDVILSSSHAVAKGVISNSRQLHITYCHTPLRYAWDLYFEYLRSSGLNKGLSSLIARLVLHYLRIFDVASTNRVDYFIANSNFVAKRIWRTYRRKAKVIYPPVEVEDYEARTEKENFYLVVSRMVPYKKVDLVVRTFNELNRRLIVIGTGPEMTKIKKIANKNVEFLGYLQRSALRGYMAKAKALIMPVIEDFGIVPVEAMAHGTPVIGMGIGGVAETVEDGKTGVLFYEQNVDSLKNAIKRFEKIEDKFDPLYIRKHSLKFGVERFKKEYKGFVEKAKEEFFS